MLNRNSSYFGLILVCCFVLAGVALAVDTPTSEKGIAVVDSAKAKTMMDGGAVMIDARVANEYAEAHIKGARSIPYKEKSDKATNFDSSQDSFDLAKLPADKMTPVIFYCNGPACWKSYKAAVLAVRAGHKRVSWLRGGIPEWKASGLPVE